MIIIKQPVVSSQNGKARLSADIVVQDRVRNVWFEVDEKFGQYLCFERSDAFLIGLLNWAMRQKHDITCLAPVGEELLYQIREYLIPSVVKASKVLHWPEIIANADTGKIQNAGAVGAGISCGIDSFHVLLHQTKSPYKNLNITHLAFNNVGAHGVGAHAKRLFLERKNRVKRFCHEFGYDLIESDSNFAEAFIQEHLLTNTYSSYFAVYALQKLWRTYFYASAHTFFEFSLADNEKKDTAYYDLLLSDMLSTSTLRIYSEGATLTRLEKTRKVVEYAPSYRYLDVCIQTSKNCGRCDKCMRTLLALDLLGCLEKYREVFDLRQYRKHKKDCLVHLVYQARKNNLTYIEMLPYFNKSIGFDVKIMAGLKEKMSSWQWLVKLYRFLKSKGGKD